MNRITIYLVIVFICFAGCKASMQGFTHLSPALKFIRENIIYDQVHKSYSMTAILSDTFVAQNKKTFDALVGLDSTAIINVMGLPDSRYIKGEFVYFFSKCPMQLHCENMSLRVIFSDKKVCIKTDIVYEYAGEKIPNPGIIQLPDK